MDVDEEQLIKLIGNMVRRRWNETNQPLRLSQLGSDLMMDAPETYNEGSAGRTLKNFILETGDRGRYRLVGHPSRLCIQPDDVLDATKIEDKKKAQPKLSMRPPLGLKGTVEIPKSNLKIPHGKTRSVFVAASDLVAPKAPQAIEGVPSALDYDWTWRRTIVLKSGSANLPSFPFPTSEVEHGKRLQACRILADDLIDKLDSQKDNVRDEYKNQLVKYVERLPENPGTGNVLLADAAARSIRSLFEAEYHFLPIQIATSLKILLEQHIGLRPFYPEIDNFYRDVRSGTLQEPLPIDAVDGVMHAVQEFTPTIFDASVETAIDDSASTVIVPINEGADSPMGSDPIPPPDPLGDLDPNNARDFQVAGVVNKLWHVFLKGEEIHNSEGAWRESYNALEPSVARILKWLASFLGQR